MRSIYFDYNATTPADPAVLEIGQFREMDWDIEAVGKHLAEASQYFGKRFGM